MPFARRTRADFVAAIERVLSDDTMARRAAEAGACFDAERDGAETAAHMIERTAASGERCC